MSSRAGRRRSISPGRIVVGRVVEARGADLFRCVRVDRVVLGAAQPENRDATTPRLTGLLCLLHEHLRLGATPRPVSFHLLEGTCQTGGGCVSYIKHDHKSPSSAPSKRRTWQSPTSLVSAAVLCSLAIIIVSAAKHSTGVDNCTALFSAEVDLSDGGWLRQLHQARPQVAVKRPEQETHLAEPESSSSRQPSTRPESTTARPCSRPTTRTRPPTRSATSLTRTPLIRRLKTRKCWSMSPSFATR
jgi:hypothetical protein